MATKDRSPIRERQPAATLADTLARQAAHRPDDTACRFIEPGGTSLADSTETTLSFRDLARRAATIASSLQGVRPGDRALLLCPPGLDYVAALFGCFYAGVIAVPAYPPLTAGVDERLKLLFTNSDPRAVLTTTLLAPLCEASGVTRLAQNAGAVTVAVDSVEAVDSERQLPRPSSPGELALLQYTSGSTGAPRGVMLSHANIMSNVGAILSHADADRTSPADKGVFWLPPYHDMGLIGGIFTPLVLGTETTLMSPLAFLSDPMLWLEAITKYCGTFSAAPNFAYDLCVRKAEDHRIADLDLESWRIVINGAEPVQQSTMMRFAECFERAGFRRSSFMPCYGLAEATLLVAGMRVGPGASAGAELGRIEAPRRLSPDGVASVGTPVDDALVLIVDPVTTRRCEDGEIGEIWCQGPCVAKGYWNNEHESSTTFQEVLSDDDNQGVFLRTGDLGMLRDGELYVTGRSKDVIIVRGQNYYPHDIERTAAEADARLRAGCIAAFDVVSDADQKIVLVAESVAACDSGVAAEIATNVRRCVAQEYGVSIDELVLIRRGDSLKTSSGKIRRGPTRAAYLGQELTIMASHRVARTGPDSSIAHSNLETALATAMAEVLGVAGVSPTDDFFALGADSANVVELAVAAEAHGAMVEPQDIYRFPTARLLSQEVGRTQSVSRGGHRIRSARNDILGGQIPRIADADTYSLSPVQRRWATDYLGDRTKTWGNLSLRLSLPDIGDIEALRAAVEAVWAAHEGLRTVFPEIDGDLRQQVLPSVTVPISTHDHSEMSAACRVAATNEVAAAEAGRVFDLAVGPAARVALVRGNASAEAIVTIHHMLADGWSLMQLRRELLRAYGEAASGVTPRIESPTIRYRDYAGWMRSLSEQGLLAEAKRYWLGELDGELPQTMPVNKEMARSGDTRGASTLVVLPSELATSLRRLAAEARFSVSALLFGEFFSSVHERTQARDLIIGTPLAGRERKDLKNVIGMFINLVPIRLRFQPGWDLKDVIAVTQDKLLGAASHQWYQLDDMVRDLGIEREAHQFPITNTFFTKISMGSQTLGPQSGAVTSSALSTDVRYQMMLYAYDFADGLVLDCRYRKALFDSGDVSSLMEQYVAGLREVVS